LRELALFLLHPAPARWSPTGRQGEGQAMNRMVFLEFVVGPEGERILAKDGVSTR
jgi:hypothetical protein